MADMGGFDAGDDAGLRFAASAASGAISPAWFMPISTTQAAACSGSRANVSGTPQWLLCEAVAAWVGPKADKACTQHLLGGGLADAAGDGDDGARRSGRGQRGRSRVRASSVSATIHRRRRA